MLAYDYEFYLISMDGMLHNEYTINALISAPIVNLLVVYSYTKLMGLCSAITTLLYDISPT